MTGAVIIKHANPCGVSDRNTINLDHSKML